MSFFRKIYPVIAVTIVVFIAVTLLTATYTVASPAIAYQRELRMVRMLGEIFPGMTNRTELDEMCRIYDASGNKIGIAFFAVGTGWGGDIDILVGIKNDIVEGIRIVRHLETPGLGARITEHEFKYQFAGLNAHDVYLRRDGGEIDAVTAATMSSRTVADAVRVALMDTIKSLRERE